MNENEYRSLRRGTSTRVFGIVLAFLIILEFCSVIMLFGRLGVFSKPKARNYISLTDPSANTHVRTGHFDEGGNLVIDTVLSYAKDDCTLLPKLNAVRTVIGLFNGMGIFGERVMFDNDEEYSDFCSEYSGHGFDVIDANATVWLTDTNVEIFKLTSENGEGVVTVAGDGSAKLIAPGTENAYTFTLRNTGDYALGYDLELEAYITGLDTLLPVNARFYDYTGKYIVGSSDTWEHVLALDGVKESNYLKPGRIADYTVEWQWPFERGGDEEDEYDTMLGDLAAFDHDITLTIVIRTVAECIEAHDDPGGGREDPPATGDDAASFVLLLIVILVLMAIVYMLLDRRRTAY